MRSLIARVHGAAFAKHTVSVADPADVAFVAGCVLVAVGAGIVALPAGLIVGGILLAWVGWRAGS